VRAAKPRALKVSLASTLGVLAFLTKLLLPTPYDKLLIVLHAYLLALSSLIAGGSGATYTGLVVGVLTTWWRPAFFPLSLAFDAFYGLTTDLLIRALKAESRSRVPAARLTAALAASSALTGVASMTAAVALGFLGMNPALYAVILVAGTLEGAAAGYLASATWNRYLSKHLGASR